MRVIFLLPLIIFLVLIFVLTIQLLAIGQGKKPDYLPSVLIGHQVPAFTLPALPRRGRSLSSTDLKGEVSLVNIFGSWCTACLAEHPFLMKIKNIASVRLHGINWHDDTKAGIEWLHRYGDPYDLIGSDLDGRVAIDLGVTGAPETFLIDKNGIIRYKHTGPLTSEIWERVFYPAIKQLLSQATVSWRIL